MCIRDRCLSNNKYSEKETKMQTIFRTVLSHLKCENKNGLQFQLSKFSHGIKMITGLFTHCSVAFVCRGTDDYGEWKSKPQTVKETQVFVTQFLHHNVINYWTWNIKEFGRYFSYWKLTIFTKFTFTVSMNAKIVAYVEVIIHVLTAVCISM